MRVPTDRSAARRTTLLAAALCASVPAPLVLRAQGITTAAIRGTVRAEHGESVDGARVRVVDAATGVAVESAVGHGRFLVQGLEVGGPYTVTVRRIGFAPQTRERLFLALGEPDELEFVLRAAAVGLDTVHVADGASARAGAPSGVATTVPDSMLHRLPTLDRNLYDFVRLAPQISTKVGFAAGGMSGGGVGFRLNDFLVGGVSERTIPGGVAPPLSGGSSVPLDAVREYQVLLAPFDVRYGDFAGALVNAVTRSGTNRLEGSAFGYARSDRLAGTGIAPYDRAQFGVTLGGPLRRDRLHFFLSAQTQRLTAPAAGPYVGQPPNAATPVPVREADLARLDAIMRGYGLSAGTGGPIEIRSPQTNVFGRLDLAVPEWRSRVVLWSSDAWARSLAFSRPPRDTFALSSFVAPTAAGGPWLTALQIHTALSRAGGGHNELLLSRLAQSLSGDPESRQPIVRVAVPGTAGGQVTVVSGTPIQVQGGDAAGRTITLHDDLTLPLGASHVATFGLAAERFRAARGGGSGTYGAWSFLSLDSLARGVADRLEVTRDLGGGAATIAGAQYGAYAGDEWRPDDRLSVTVGLRADVLALDGRRPYNAVVDSIFGRRTDETPDRRVHWSPRLGLTWDPSGTGRDRLRGGVGLFTARPPLGWAQQALSSYGSGVGVLRCGRLPTDRGLPPPFAPVWNAQPTACANDSRGVPPGDVDLLDPRLHLAQTLRVSLAYERRLPWELLGTVEALVTRNRADFVFVNLNLVGPQGVDRNGRVLYGTISSTGASIPALRSTFSEVVDVRNTSLDYAAELSARLERRFSRGVAATASYTHTRARDVQTPLRSGTAFLLNWASRAVSGRHDDLSTGVSLNDVPHRVVLAATLTAPWKRWPTDVSLDYVGESGSPFTYVARGAGRRGDLNADGSNANDPIYVPRSALDSTEIRFAGTADSVRTQQAGFERYIDGESCLRRQRGSILARNSCREPWSHTSIASVRQGVRLGARDLTVEVDVFNVLGLLRRGWGLYRVAAPQLLEHVGQSADGQSVFRFATTAPRWTTLPAESAFQLQAAVRYRF